jgi:ribosome-associated protein
LKTLSQKLKLQRKLPLGVDAETSSGWVLLDYGDVIVHIFDPGTRDFYDLEELWQNAPVVVRIQ